MLIFIVICLFLALRMCFYINIKNITFNTSWCHSFSVVLSLNLTSRHAERDRKKKKLPQSPCWLVHAQTHLHFLTAFEGIILCSYGNMSPIILQTTARQKGQFIIICTQARVTLHSYMSNEALANSLCNVGDTLNCRLMFTSPTFKVTNALGTYCLFCMMPDVDRPVKLPKRKQRLHQKQRAEMHICAILQSHASKSKSDLCWKAGRMPWDLRETTTKTNSRKSS